MRYPPGHKEKTRLSIITAASKVFRELGYHGSGVDAIMAEANLTAGGFYNHFKNKDDLLISMIKACPEITMSLIPEEFASLSGKEWVRESSLWYLSKDNRDHPELYCPIPTIVSEIGRQTEDVQKAFTESSLFWETALIEQLTDFPEEKRTMIAQNIMMICMGAITTARAMGPCATSDLFIENARAQIELILAD